MTKTIVVVIDKENKSITFTGNVTVINEKLKEKSMYHTPAGEISVRLVAREIDRKYVNGLVIHSAKDFFSDFFVPFNSQKTVAGLTVTHKDS